MRFMNDISWVPGLRTPFLNSFFDLVTLAGYPTFLILLLTFGYLFFSARSFFHTAMLLIATGLLNTFLKDVFQDPRPAAEYMLDPRTGTSYGWPSGHAQIAVVLWGFLAYEIGQRWAYIAAAVIASLICFSRIYLGVHDIGDVLGGTTIGFACLVAYIWGINNVRLRQMVDNLGHSGLLLALLLVHIVYILVYPAHGEHVAPVWLVGIMMGWVIARQWMEHSEVELPGTLIVRLLIASLGTASAFGLLIVTISVPMLLALEGIPDTVVSYSFGAIFGLATAWLLPRLIQRLPIQ